MKREEKLVWVYVVYKVEDNDLDNVEIFANYADAHWFVETHEGYKIWQRPLK